MVIRQGGAAEAIGEGIRAGVPVGLQRERSLGRACCGISSTAQPDLQVAKGRLLRTTLTFLLALLFTSRLDLDFLSVGADRLSALVQAHQPQLPACLPPSFPFLPPLRGAPSLRAS